MPQNYNNKLKNIIDAHLNKVPEVKSYCQRCLDTARWDGNVITMIVDASFTSIGLNYFQTVVPNVALFKKQFIDNVKIKSFRNLVNKPEQELYGIWKNKRSWRLAKDICSYLATLKEQTNLDNKNTFIYWAGSARLESWENDPIGKIKGLGVNTFQYLRMMGGIDTVMPDKIVKRIINEILVQSGETVPITDLDFIRTVEKIGADYGYRPIELCWMTWLVQSESNLGRMQKYSDILSKI